MGLFVFTASKSRPKKHIQRSIANPIPRDICEKNLKKDLLESLRRDSADRELYAWGAQPGPRNKETWRSLQKGDYVLTYQLKDRVKVYTFVSRVLDKLHDVGMARAVWGTSDDPPYDTWEYMYFLDKPVRVYVPLQQVNHVLQRGSKRPYGGFTEINYGAIRRIESSYGSVDVFIRQAILGPAIGTATTRSM